MTQLSESCDAKISKLCSSYDIVVKHNKRGTLAEMPLSATDLDLDGHIHEDAVARIGWIAVLRLLSGMECEGLVRVTDFQLNQFQIGEGDFLVAEPELIFSTSERAGARARIYRMGRGGEILSANCLAEYSVTADILLNPSLVVSESSKNKARLSQHSVGMQEVKLSPQKQAMSNRHRRIFEGACEVIGKEGYAATTLRKVAKAAEVPVSTIYQYIETKEDLLFMITSHCMEEIFDYMTTELEREGDANTKMQRAIDAYVKYISKNRRYINLAYRETRSLSRANRERIFDIERRFASLWEEIIITGNETDQFTANKTRLAANMVYFFCNVWALRYWSIQDYTEGEVRDYLMRFIMGGLKGDEKSLV